MESSAHAHHWNPTQVTKDHLTSMSLDGGLAEVRDLLEGYPFDNIDLVAQQSQSCAADNGHLWGKVGNTEGVGDLHGCVIAESVIGRGGMGK